MNMEEKNFIDILFVRSINLMSTEKWHWPKGWSVNRKLQFLNDSLNYAKQNELWEQAAIIRDVQKAINK